MSFDKLQQWHELYSVAAGVAATLMGLMFVVISLRQGSHVSEDVMRITRALHTPIVVFFVTIVAVSILMLMPNTPPAWLGAALVAIAAGGVIYMVANGAYRIWRESDLGVDDLIWYVALPYFCYVLLGVAAAMIWTAAPYGPHVEAATILLLLLVGIRNAWDLIVYSVQRRSDDADEKNQ